ncbi:MAG TPA: hypothetical protein VMM12_08880 [Longimicrobiales bacterium]|nr:hypothetical protein [Longimicrobiales bacterium]
MRTLVFGLAMLALALVVPAEAAAQQAQAKKAADRDAPAMTLHIGADGVARLVPAGERGGPPFDLPIPGRRGADDRDDDDARRGGPLGGDGPWNGRGTDRDDDDRGPPPFVGDLLSTVLGGIFGNGGLLSRLPVPGNR